MSLKEIHAESWASGGGGLIEQFLLRATDPWQERLVFLDEIRRWSAQQRGLPVGQRALCLACDHEFASVPSTFAIMRAARPGTCWLTLTGVCSACEGKTDEVLLEISSERLRAMGLLRDILKIHPDAGHS